MPRWTCDTCIFVVAGGRVPDVREPCPDCCGYRMRAARKWHEIEPKDALDLNLSQRLDIEVPLNEEGERCPWPWEPQQLVGAPLGQYPLRLLRSDGGGRRATPGLCRRRERRRLCRR